MGKPYLQVVTQESGREPAHWIVTPGSQSFLLQHLVQTSQVAALAKLVTAIKAQKSKKKKVVSSSWSVSSPSSNWPCLSYLDAAGAEK